MRSAGASATSMNTAVSGLRFFFGVTLGRDDAAVGMTGVREPRKLPVVLSLEEVARLLDAATSLKYKAALSVAYGTGLRASEVVSLKLTDINSEREVIRVDQSLPSGQNPVNPLTSRAYWRLANGLHNVVTRFGESLDLTTLRADGAPNPLTGCINLVSGSGTYLAWLIPYAGEREDCEFAGKAA
jgi:integrase